MKAITLEDLWSDPSKEIIEEMKQTWALSPWNRQVFRNRINRGEMESCIYMVTHDGNVPESNERLLDVARCYAQTHFFTLEECKKYLLPAINKMIDYNNNFVRWMPGYVIQNKETGDKSIVEYDYALGFGGRNYTSLSVINLDEEGNLCFSWAWADYNNFKLVDKEHTSENIARLKSYHQSHDDDVPYYLNQDLAQELYGKPSRERPFKQE